MAGPNYVLDKGFIADGAVSQFHVVVMTGDENMAQATVAGADPLGVCQEEVEARDAGLRVANARILGITRVVCGAAIARRDKLAVAADGRVVPATATVLSDGTAAGTLGDLVVGIAWTPTTAAGQHLDMLLTPGERA